VRERVRCAVTQVPAFCRQSLRMSVGRFGTIRLIKFVAGSTVATGVCVFRPTQNSSPLLVPHSIALRRPPEYRNSDTGECEFSTSAHSVGHGMPQALEYADMLQVRVCPLLFSSTLPAKRCAKYFANVCQLRMDSVSIQIGPFPTLYCLSLFSAPDSSIRYAPSRESP
jgi:hypothetical protein